MTCCCLEAGHVTMAQFIMKSLWIRPLCQRVSGQLWRRNVPCRTSCIGFGRTTHPSRGTITHLLSSNRIQRIDSTSSSCPSSPLSTNTDDKYKLIYKFPAIRFCRTVSRLKLVQTTMTILILPPLFYYHLQGQISHFAVVYCTGTALFAGAMLYGLSYYLRRIIGMMYVNEDLTTVKVSYLTFWGNRRNIFVPIEDIKRLSETGDVKWEILRQFARYSDPDILYFTTRYGYIVDKEKFIMVFGKLE